MTSQIAVVHQTIVDMTRKHQQGLVHLSVGTATGPTCPDHHTSTNRQLDLLRDINHTAQNNRFPHVAHFIVGISRWRPMAAIRLIALANSRLVHVTPVEPCTCTDHPPVRWNVHTVELFC